MFSFWKKFSQNMKRNRVFQMKSKIWYIIHFFWKKARKIFHSILFQTLKTCAKNSAKTWNINRFFRWNSKSDTLSTFSEKKRARFFIPKLFQTQNLARKIQPKHETQRRFSDFYFFMIHNPVCTCKNCVKIYPDIFSQNMKRKDVFQILTQNMKRNPLYTCKNCVKIYPE